MSTQALISLVTIGLIISRAVGILVSPRQRGQFVAVGLAIIDRLVVERLAI